MNFVDANILLYAEDSLSEKHLAARIWWDDQLSGSEPVALCWQTLNAFIRITTNPRLHKRPLTLKEATERVQSWLNQACVRVIVPTDAHWQIFQQMLRVGNASGNLVSDAHWQPWPWSITALSRAPTPISPDSRASNGKTPLRNKTDQKPSPSETQVPSERHDPPPHHRHPTRLVTAMSTHPTRARLIHPKNDPPVG